MDITDRALLQVHPAFRAAHLCRFFHDRFLLTLLGTPQLRE